MSSYLELAATVADIAAGAPTGPVPTQAPTGSGGLNATGVGSLVFGALLFGLVVGKWKGTNKDGKTMFFLAIVLTTILGSTTGIFGSLTDAVRDTSDSVGTSITDTTTGR
jgi:uncharacterized membrane-anchored protein